MREGDICFVVALALENLELYHRRWVHRTTIRRGLDGVSNGRKYFELLIDVTHIWPPNRMLWPFPAAE